MSDKYTYKKISEIKPEYAAKEVKDASGNILSWDQVLKHYPDYKIAVDEEGRPIDNSTRKNTPALDYHRLVKITENDPNGPYAAAKWLLGQLAMLPISAIGAVTAPVSATVGGLVGGIGGDVLGHYASDWIFDNPDKEYNLLNSDITITPRLASRLVGGLGGGLLGGYSGYAATEKVAKPYLISRELNRAAKEFDGTVGDNYFTAPDKFYRVTSSPEIYGLAELGMNVTTRDLPTMPNQADVFRTLVLEKGLVPGKGELEGYWIYPENIRKGALQKRINEELGIKSNRFNLDENPAIFKKHGSSHGNRTLAAWQNIWKGSTANDSRFPEYMLEGSPLQNLTIPYGKNRSYYIDTPIDKVPKGARVGFKTGEMPMEGLNKFRLLPNGRYLYEGPVLPDKRIVVGRHTAENIFGNKHIFNTRSSKLTDAERIGIPKGDRNQPTNPPLLDFGKVEYTNLGIKAPLLGIFLGSGSESLVFDAGNRVNKIVTTPWSNIKELLIIPLFTRDLIGSFVKNFIIRRNKHPFFEPMKFEGVILNNGELNPVISQRKLVPLKGDEIIDLPNKLHETLSKYGYKLITKSNDGFNEFRNKIGTITDLNAHNLGYTPEGELKAFDLLEYNKGGIIKKYK